MVIMSMVLEDRVWTREERDGLPDDGFRYELLDGKLIVTPLPRVPHQAMVVGLVIALAHACPPELRVFTAPLDVTLAQDTVLEPDVLVVRRSQASGATLEGVPLLAAEVLSPTTRMIDRNLKQPRFERAGCASFWLLDPDVPSVTAWELDASGRYVEVAHVEGNASWTATELFAVTIVPSALMA